MCVGVEKTQGSANYEGKAKEKGRGGYGEGGRERERERERERRSKQGKVGQLNGQPFVIISCEREEIQKSIEYRRTP